MPKASSPPGVRQRRHVLASAAISMARMLRGLSALMVMPTSLTLSVAHQPDSINTISGRLPDLPNDSVYTGPGLDAPPPTPLATLRKRQLLSQRALAKKAGVALSTIYLLEAGRTERVTFKVMRAVSEALGVPAESVAEFRRTVDA
jgi:DNA-binding XRE family transcriptional regulator